MIKETKEFWSNRANLGLMVLLIVTILGNLQQRQIIIKYAEETKEYRNAAQARGIQMIRNDSVTHEFLRAILKGQINTHYSQSDILTKFDSLNKQKVKQ